MLDPLRRDLRSETLLPTRRADTSFLRLEIAAQILAGFALLCALALGLLASLLARLLIYELVHVLTPRLSTHVTRRTGKIIVVSLRAHTGAPAARGLHPADAGCSGQCWLKRMGCGC
jgi:hypothetical protein